ncbi:MAG: phosphodiester glycosidase family protein [Clostridiales bacterium]|nr:phosphodiester glycosidase family protein [Clostridiales bacterium]
MKKTALFSLLVAALMLLPLFFVQAAPAITYLQFGQYPTTQDGRMEPILWKVLQNDAEGVLLLSEFVLDAKAVQDSGRYNGYEYSTLKTWLEADFVAKAFSAGEQALIKQDQGAFAVRLPSVEELRVKDGGFFDAEGVRARPTDYAIAQGVQKYPSGDASYWTSNRASSQPTGQRRVLDKGSFGYAIATYATIGVRPMIVLAQGALQEAAGTGEMQNPFVVSLPEAITAPQETADAGAVNTDEDTATEDSAAAEAAQQAQAAPLLTEGFPELTADGFLKPGEAPYVFKDEENGVWRYASQTLRIVITRQQDVEAKLRWFESQVFFKDGERFQMYPNDPGNRHKMKQMEKIADQHNLVFAVNGDYYIYRVNRRNATKTAVAIGRVARNFKLLYDTNVSPNRTSHPNLDVMALYPDGTMSVHGANEKTTEQLLAMGAMDVLAFGPMLIRDGVINEKGVANFGVTQQPRAGLGMVRKGHFIHLMMESRTSKSKGANTTWMAERFKLLGCDTAFNLDGGQTAVVIFMGEQLNEIGKYDNKTNSRLQNEVMGIGQR